MTKQQHHADEVEDAHEHPSDTQKLSKTYILIGKLMSCSTDTSK